MLSFKPQGLLWLIAKFIFFSLYLMLCHLGVPSPLARVLFLCSSCLLNSCEMLQPGVLRPQVTFAARVTTLPSSFHIFKGYQLKMSGQL